MAPSVVDASPTQRAADRRRDRRLLAAFTGAAGLVYAISAALQASFIFRSAAPDGHGPQVLTRIGVNLLAVGMLLVILLMWGQHRRQRHSERVWGVVVAAGAMSVTRAVAQVVFGVYPTFVRATTTVEVVGGLISGIVSATFGTWAMVWERTSRQEARAARASAARQALALHALEDEEVRVRRAVAEGLHASVQQRLVLVVAQIDRTLPRLAEGTASSEDVEALRAARDELERLRVQDVRETSRMLYPDQLDVGLIPAVRAMLRRVPASIATRLQVDDSVRALDDPAVPVLSGSERLLAVRVIEEGIANALRHGRPGTLVVDVALAGDRLVVTVEDDGGGLAASAGPASGTRRLAERLAVVDGSLELTGTPGGARLSAQLPVAGL